MANLHITELSGLGATEQSDSVLALAADAIVANQNVAIGAGSVQSAAFHVQTPPNTKTPIQQATTPPNKSTSWVVLTAGAACTVAFGLNPTAVAGSGLFLNVGEKIFVRVPQGLSWKVAVITDAL